MRTRASIYRHIGVSLELHELHGKPVAVDIAWWKLRAWWVDTPSFYRPGAEQTHGYRETLARLLSVLSLALGSENELRFGRGCEVVR